MMPDIGQIVLYSLTEEQAQEISRRRQQSVTPSLTPGVLPGDSVPMLVAAIASGYKDGLCAVAGRLMLDDEDESWWVTSVTEGVEPGAWRPI
jgi:hypothetical protein